MPLIQKHTLDSHCTITNQNGTGIIGERWIAGTFDHMSCLRLTHHGCFSLRANRKYIVDYCGNGAQMNSEGGKKLTTMGNGDHFTTQLVYGVGIAAHGDDAYRLGHASLWQAIGGAKWNSKFVADDLDLCISTDDPGCYPNIEIKIEGSDNFPENNDGVFWRTDNERVPYNKLCVRKKTLTASSPFCEDIQRCDHEANTSCGSDRTMTLSTCGSENADQVNNLTSCTNFICWHARSPHLRSTGT